LGDRCPFHATETEIFRVSFAKSSESQRQFRRRPETAIAQDCVVVDAFRCNRSSPEFPDNREINREFLNFGQFSAIRAPNRRANSRRLQQNSLRNGTGNFFGGTGNLFEGTGNFSKTSKHQGKRPFLAHLFCGSRTRSVLVSDLQWRERYGGRASGVAASRRGLRRAHHEDWKRSDLNQRQYCEAEGIPLKAFGNWRAQFKAEPQPLNASCSTGVAG
jgi:hypothetical protein